MPQNQRTVAIIQARLGSTRLPGKVLRDIAGKTMIQRVVERVQQANTLDEIVIATTNEPADQELVDFCESQAWNVFIGREHDVLDRYVKTAKKHSADRIVRITSDCPLIEPTIIDQVVNSLGDHDYACNFHPLRRFPQGLDCEILTRSTLEKIDQLANQQRYREHVTLYVYRNETRFSIGSVLSEEDHSYLRWTVDTAEDLELVRTIYEYFEQSLGESNFTWEQIITACHSHPEWLEINQHTKQKVA